MQRIELKQLVSYSNHTVKDNGIVKLLLKASYSELANTIKELQLLNNDITVLARLNKETYSLGSFRLSNIVIDGDGESKISLASTTDFVELDNINKLATMHKEVKEFYIKMASNIEKEGE